jgi:hypothetical protein
MTCPVCEAPLELVSHDRYRGLRFPGASLFRCAEHGPVLLRREGLPPLTSRADAPGDSHNGHSPVRVPLVPRPTPLAGAIALPEPDDDDRPADRVAGHWSFG